MSAARTSSAPGASPWIRSRRWDLLFIFASVALVTVPLATYYAVTYLTGTPPQSFQERQALSIAMFINLFCAFFIGGPHMYATYTMTLGEPRFRERHATLYRAALLVPLAVVSLAVARIELLMTIFFAWASVHAVHQIAFLVRQYQMRAERPHELPGWSRAIDYALALFCFYPIILWRLLAPRGAVLRLPFGIDVLQGFRIGEVDLSRQLPAAVQGQVWIAWLGIAFFSAAVVAFLARTAWEIATGRVVWPRTLLLLCTVPVVFALPLFENMDVSLQGFNLWHSTQYIGLVYLMNAYRKERGEISSDFVDFLSGVGNGYRYYAFLVFVSMSAGGLMGFLHWVIGLPMLQVYYAVLLSGLWVHYLWDHAIFAHPESLLPPVASIQRAAA